VLERPALDRAAHHLLQRLHVRFIVGRDEADRVADGLGAAGPSDAMDVILGVHRKVEVDHV